MKTEAAAPAQEMSDVTEAKVKAAAAAMTLGTEPSKMSVELPEVRGSRLTVDQTHELWFRYCKAHETSFRLPTKLAAVNLLKMFTSFLFGDLKLEAPEATPEAIATAGGLVRLFEVKLAEGVHFKHRVIDNRVYRNPRKDAPAGQSVLVNNRVSVVMSTQIEDGTVTYGTGDKDNFVPYEVQPVGEDASAAIGAEDSNEA